MPVDVKAALEAADHLHDYERHLLATLVSRRSVRAEASDVHELCAGEISGMGMDVELVTPRLDELVSHPEWCPPYPASAEPERMVSVLGSWGEGPGVFLFAHTDTKRPDPRGDWDTDPYRATEIGDRIHGVGTADDKAGVVSVLAATRALLPHLDGVRVVVGLVHGKLGGGLGTLPTMARVGEVDTSVYCHPAETGRGLTHFKIATRGFFNFRIETVGRRPDPVEIRTPNSEDPPPGCQRLQPVAGGAGRRGPLGGSGRPAVLGELGVRRCQPDRAAGEGGRRGHRMVPPRDGDRGVRDPGPGGAEGGRPVDRAVSACSPTRPRYLPTILS